MKKNRKGFTLAELLIVVAIIAVLVAISIPIFTSQLEKSREATDLANLRSAYAVAAACVNADEDPAKSRHRVGVDVTYVYSPSNSELIYFEDAWKNQNLIETCGKGTVKVGSENNTWDGSAGIQYNPKNDVSGDFILVVINWQDSTVKVHFNNYQKNS